MSPWGTAAYDGLPPLVARAARDLPARPLDLLVLDGGAHGKSGGIPADPEALLRPGGTIVIDDLARPPAGHPGRRGSGCRGGLCGGS